MAQIYEWAVRDFSEGLLDKIDLPLMPENAASDCRNFLSKTQGMLEKRKGQVYLNSISLGNVPINGLDIYYKGANSYLLAACGGNIYKWNGSAFESIKTGWDANCDVFFETCANYVVAFNGKDTPIKYDGTTVTTLANAPTDGQYPILHKEKLFVAPQSHPDQVWWSESFNPETWPAENYWTFKAGDGDKIVALKRLYDELIIFKQRSIHALRGTNLDDFSGFEIIGDIGCVGPRAVGNFNNRLYFVGEKGLYEFNGVKVANISDNRIPNLWAKINKQYLYKSAVGCYGKYVWFALPYDTSTYNNLVICYEPDTGTFWPFDSINASCFLKLNNNNGEILYTGSSVNGHVIQQDIGDRDFPNTSEAKNITAYWVGKAYDLGTPQRIKKGKRLFIEDYPHEASSYPATVQISVDFGQFVDMELVGEATIGKVYKFPMNCREWHYIRPKVIHNNTGQCYIRGIMIRHKVKGKPKFRGGVLNEQ